MANVLNSNCDYEKVMEILEREKGYISWRQLCRICNVNHSVPGRIRRHEYTPGTKTLMKFCMIRPLEKRNELLQELLLAAGFGSFRSL